MLSCLPMACYVATILPSSSVIPHFPAFSSFRRLGRSTNGKGSFPSPEHYHMARAFSCPARVDVYLSYLRMDGVPVWLALLQAWRSRRERAEDLLAICLGTTRDLLRNWIGWHACSDWGGGNFWGSYPRLYRLNE